MSLISSCQSVQELMEMWPLHIRRPVFTSEWKAVREEGEVRISMLVGREEGQGCDGCCVTALR